MNEAIARFATDLAERAFPQVNLPNSSPQLESPAPSFRSQLPISMTLSIDVAELCGVGGGCMAGGG